MSICVRVFVCMYLCVYISVCIFVYVYLCLYVRNEWNDVKRREGEGEKEGRVPDNQKSRKRTKLIELNKNDKKYDKSKGNQHMIIKQTFCLLNSV